MPESWPLDASFNAAKLTACLKMLASHPLDESVQFIGCWTLSSGITVAADHASQALALAHGAVPAAVAAVLAHPHHPEICAYAAHVLSSVARDYPAGQLAVVEAGAPAALLGAMAAQGGDSNVVLYSIGALSTLANACPAGQLALVGAPGALAAAMAAFPASAHIAQFACKALHHLAQQEAGRLAALAAGAPAQLLAAAEAHAADATVMEWAGRALTVITQERRHIVLCKLPPEQRAARLASCQECWLASPRRACARDAAPHSDAHQCSICLLAGEDEARPWAALPCGHLLHTTCLMQWAATETRAARAAPSLPFNAKVHCPLDRCVVSRQVMGGGGMAQRLWRRRSCSSSSSAENYCRLQKEARPRMRGVCPFHSPPPILISIIIL